MDIVIKLLQFFLCFTVIVGLHEFGHYIMARIFGIRVEKFFIFFDPWFSLFKFKHKETVYGLGWLPLGGYVQIGGMIDESMDKSQIEGPVRPDDFRAKPAWQRFLVMVAGVVMNLLTAIVIYCAVCFTWGDSYLANEDVKWGYDFNEAAEELGFVDGDKLLSINGEKVENVAVHWASTGVDETETVTLRYPWGLATLTASIGVRLDERTVLMGDKVEPRRDYITEHADFNKPDNFEVPTNQQEGGV